MERPSASQTARACRTIVLGLAVAAAGFVVPTGQAAVGDPVHQIHAPLSGADTFCSIGLAFDGASLYYDRCGDREIHRIDPMTGALQGSFDPGIPQLPNALAFDAKRNGLWIGAQACAPDGMPIHFWDFDDNSVTTMFTIPAGLVNPATGSTFLSLCFVDGLAYNENDASLDGDDDIWFSDDVNRNLGLFRPDGTLVAGFDSATLDPSLATQSGLAVGGPNLYLGNNGGGDVFRADIASFTLVDQFVSADERQEDMECDPVTFAPTDVMWVRTTPQGGAFPDVMTAFEIEKDTCGLGGQNPGELALDPPQAENPAGSDHAVTATATSNGAPIAGALVSFEVSAGPNAGEASDPGECTANADCTTDANGQVTWTYTSNGAVGQDVIVACFVDATNETRCARALKDWVDGTPPEATCTPTTNPSGNHEPNAGNNPRSGQNPDGFYELGATDNVDASPDIYVLDTGSGTLFGPFEDGTSIKYTEANGATPSIREGTGDVDWFIKGTGDAEVFAVDDNGNASAHAACLVPQPPK